MWTFRIKYTKLGRIRFISHLDMVRALTRALNRGGIPVAYSEGFNPHQKLSMGPALPLGYESTCELADVTLMKMLAPREFHERLAANMPAGLDLLESGLVSGSSPRLSDASSACYMIRLGAGAALDNAHALVREFLVRDSAPFERARKKGTSVVDVRQLVADLGVETGQDLRWLRVEITMGGQGTCSASEAAQAILKLPPEKAKCLRIMKTEIRFGGRPLRIKANEEIQEEGNFKEQ
ncbi:DUF2344 domain-containing protein [Candidatus Poribacteria bacterium]|nr:DUF2344 domain-containing protein [Candidatus Poribacteria bacterium]